MTRDAAIRLLASRLADAPNYNHFVAWLGRQTNAMLGELAGEPIYEPSEKLRTVALSGFALTRGE